MRVLTLVGLMGAGKSTVGRLLAQRWSWDAVDLDDAVVARAGMPIPTIFETLGQSAFRNLEGEVLRELLARERLVIATGGGAPCQPGAMDAIGEAGPSVWLTGPPELLAERALSAGGRPLLAGLDSPQAVAFLVSQLASRGRHYQRADVTIDVAGRSPAQVVDSIVDSLGATLRRVDAS